MLAISVRAAFCFPFTMSGRTLSVTIPATMAMRARTARNSIREKPRLRRQRAESRGQNKDRCGSLSAFILLPSAFTSHRISRLQHGQDRREDDEPDDHDEHEDQGRFEQRR